MAHARGGRGTFPSSALSFSCPAENLPASLILGKTLGEGLSQAWLLPSLLPVSSLCGRNYLIGKFFHVLCPGKVLSRAQVWEGQTVSRAESSSENPCWMQAMKTMVQAPKTIPEQGTKQEGREGDASSGLPHLVTCWKH